MQSAANQAEVALKLGQTAARHRTQHPFADPMHRTIRSTLEQVGAQVKDAVRTVICITNCRLGGTGTQRGFQETPGWV